MEAQQVPMIDLAAAAHARGKALPAPHLPNMERRQGVRYVAELSRNLSEEEMATLATATSLREQALDKARVGDLHGARASLVEALEFIGAHISRPEARASARSYYAAAAAFVEFSEHNLQAAYELMSEALILCRQIHNEFGHGVEVRRVHLSRNVARVLWCMGKHADAWRLCLNLLDYLWVEDAAWPLAEDTDIAVSVRERLRLDERVFLTDQLLSEAISTALDAGRHNVSLIPVLAADDGWIAGGPVDRINEIGALCQALAATDDDAALQLLARCFEHGQGVLPMTWHRLEKLFDEVSGTPLLA